jgi:DNA-directed RNA polymerase specialized sigma24 family protein
LSLGGDGRGKDALAGANPPARSTPTGAGGGPTEVDRLFARVRRGDERAFEAWMTRVEPHLWKRLAPWAQAVDVEGVVQETLLRMWVYALDRGEELEGRNASLRFALGMARNVARNEARRLAREVRRGDRSAGSDVIPDPPEGADEVDGDPPVPDPFLRRLILACIEKLPRRPREALMARIVRGHLDEDRVLAAELGMRKNTFLQNIVRARSQVAECLAENGAPLEEVMP